MVLVIAPWNYPYLTAVNSVVPALLAGNAVVLRHSAQTPAVRRALRRGLRGGGAACGRLPVRALRSRGATPRMIASPEVSFVAFTGLGGRRACRAAGRQRSASSAWGSSSGARTPPTCAPTRISPTRCRIWWTAPSSTPASPAAASSGSTCSAQPLRGLRGRPSSSRGGALSPGRPPRSRHHAWARWCGPAQRTSCADQVAGGAGRGCASRAAGRGALRVAIEAGTPYLAPQVLVDVEPRHADHARGDLRSRALGDRVRLRVTSEAAIAQMNDSDFGLTASVWTRDEEAALCHRKRSWRRGPSS